MRVEYSPAVPPRPPKQPEMVAGNLYLAPQLDNQVRLCVSVNGNELRMIQLDTGKQCNSLSSREYGTQYVDVTVEWSLTEVGL